MPESSEASLASLVDEALHALGRGDTSSAVELATEVLRRDPANVAAREVIRDADAAPGEMRLLAIMFVDIVGSTGLSTRLATGSYRRLVRRCHSECEPAIIEHGGRIARKMGDGLLVMFGHPAAHEDDTARAVRAGLALTRRVAAVGPDLEREFGERVEVRVAVHLGRVQLDLLDSEIYGLAPNLAARLQELAAPNTVAVSEAVVDLVGDMFELEDRGLHTVKGVEKPIRQYTVIAEHLQGPQTRAPAAPSPYVSRLGELDAAAASVSAARYDPEHAGLVIKGEPGIGKTRTVLEALARTADSARRVLWLICSEDERSNEFGAAASLLRLDPAVSSLPEPSERLGKLEHDLRSLGLDLDTNVPLLAPLLGIAPEVGYAPAEADLGVLRDQILGALRGWLEKLSSTTVVIAVDDLQWADDSTVELLSSLVRQPIPGVRIIGTERTGSARLGGSTLRVIDLAPLSSEDATRLARAVAGGLDEAELEAVLDRGQGNPLFVQELARTIDGPQPDVGPEAITRLERGTVVPRALYEPLLSRIYRQGTDVGLAQAAATIGRNFRLDTLHAVSDRARDLVGRGLQSLLDAGLVERDDERASYWFRHALIRDLAYDLMPDEQREAMHGRVADALRVDREQGHQVAWSTIAGHLRSAHRALDAAEAFELAAEEALERGALEPSYEHLSAAIDLVESLDDSDTLRVRLAQLRLRRGFLSVSQGGPANPRAAADYEACLQLTREHSTGTEFATTLVGLYSYYAAKGDLDLADEMITRIRATGITDDPDVADESHASEGIVRWFQGRFVEAMRCFELSMEHTPDLDAADEEFGRWQIPQDTVATTALHAALTLWQRGDALGFAEHTRRAMRRARDLPFPYGPFTSLYVLTYEVLVLHEMGQYDLARSEIEAGQRIVDAHQLSFWPIALGMASAVNEAGRRIAAGDHDAAALAPLAGQIAGAATMYRMVGTAVIVPYALTNQAEVLHSLGDHSGADAVLDEACTVAQDTGSSWYSAETHRLRAHVLRALHASEHDVLDELRAAASLAREQGSVPFEIRALTDLRAAGAEVSGLDELAAIPGALECSGLEASTAS